MKVKAGDIVKDIPQEYACGLKFIKTYRFDKPDKIRLSQWERFLFAEAAWRSKQSNYIKECLDGFNPMQCVEQESRDFDLRYIIRYEDAIKWKASAIVPTGVFRTCPKDLISREKINWK